DDFTSLCGIFVVLDSLVEIRVSQRTDRTPHKCDNAVTVIVLLNTKKRAIIPTSQLKEFRSVVINIDSRRPKTSHMHASATVKHSSARSVSPNTFGHVCPHSINPRRFWFLPNSQSTVVPQVVGFAVRKGELHEKGYLRSPVAR